MGEVMPVQSGYDRWAKVYDHDANPLQALEEPILVERIGSVQGLNVLDLGCGTGRHALRMAAKGAQVTAVDFSAEMLAKAKQKPHAEAINFVTHDLSQPLPIDTPFDLVVCGLVLEHIHDLSAFYRELFQSTKASGRVFISFMHSVMFALGTQARFTDPDDEQLVEVESRPHTVSDVVMAAIETGFTLTHVSEHSPDAAFAAEFPRAAKDIGWPMLVVQKLTKP